MADVSSPYGCKFCNRDRSSHGMSYAKDKGMHFWEKPDDSQIKERMLARRGRVPKGEVFAMEERSRINVDDFYDVLWALADNGWLVFKDDK